jgi:hypothetical protein
VSRAGLFVLLLVVWVPNLAAQTIVRPEAPLDSARSSLRDALLVLRDSLSSIDAAAGRLQRDYQQSSGASLVSRARVMSDACARSARTVPPTRQAVIAADASNDARVKRQRELVQALAQLHDALARCQSSFGAMSKPGQGEQVRGYGNDRAVRVQAALRKYERVAGDFLAAMGIKVTPRGDSPRPLAG